jgi:LuxR family quorum-sensing system transcriptional regulator SolR
MQPHLSINQSLIAERDILEICEKSLGLYGIRYLEFLRLYDDGSCIILASNKELIQYLFDNNVAIIAPIQDQFIQDNFHYFVLPIGCYERAIHDIKAHYSLAYFLNLVERHPGYVDLYCFGADAYNHNIMNFYLNQIEILVQFKDYFKEKLSDLINRALTNKILLPSFMLPPYKGLKHTYCKIRENPLLTDRQVDCLYYLMNGMTAKQIAKRLNLSPRTVENHLEAIKVKMNCYSRIELFQKGQELKIICKKFKERWQ